jgi:hypothetical protein
LRHDEESKTETGSSVVRDTAFKKLLIVKVPMYYPLVPLKTRRFRETMLFVVRIIRKYKVHSVDKMESYNLLKQVVHIVTTVLRVFIFLENINTLTEIFMMISSAMPGLETNASRMTSILTTGRVCPTLSRPVQSIEPFC